MNAGSDLLVRLLEPIILWNVGWEARQYWNSRHGPRGWRFIIDLVLES